MGRAGNRRGWLEIVEVTIAGLLVFYYLGSMSSFFKYTQSSLDDSVRVRKLAEDTIITLDNIPRGTTTVMRDDLNKRDHRDLINQTDYFIRYPYAYSYEITYPNETYTSRKPPKKLSASASYLIFDNYNGKPVRYPVKLLVWSVG